ncbi:hypothetical protein N7527_004645 [Penicillium freii]|uniref:Fungal-type protein kinase domain-containing protein n=1 Tax=Penicillium freii TaxID=48697 RepID=A0A101MPD5_PENFR|nr:hypothetical protein N7527_004645 [Penicillium freii]KUM64231.1 hypothetical protein ACN42_g2874 [Penicillium freii]
MPPPKIFALVPETLDQWYRAARNSGQDHNPHEQQQWNSASKLTKQEYLLLRCLWIDHGDDKTLEILNFRKYFKAARDWLDKFPPFQAYLQQVRTQSPTTKFNPADNAAGPWGSGIFEVPAVEQNRISSRLARQQHRTPRNTKREIDEDSVNLSLVAFLVSLAAKHPSIHSHWTPHKKPLKATFRNGAIMEAQIDGYFGEEEGPIKIMLETKAEPRDFHEPQVSIQEAAEVVALLMTQRVDSNRRVILFLQDGADLYVTLAAFDKTYLDWIKNKRKKLPNHQFLQMNRYGSWNLTSADDMKEFAVIALGIMLEADR